MPSFNRYGRYGQKTVTPSFNNSSGRKWLMINLIPAWPQEASRAQEDATVNLVQLLATTAQPTRLIVTDYRPTLRYFLAANDLLETEWLNVFDVIQQVHHNTGLPLGVEDIVWPKDVQAIYGVNEVYLYREEQLVGTVTMAQPGFVETVEWQTEMGTRTEFYDDRGFLSASFDADEDANVTRRTWWTPQGQQAMIQDQSGYHWSLAPDDLPKDYATFEALLGAVLTPAVATEDHFVVRLTRDNHALAQFISEHWQTTLQVASQMDLPDAADAALISASHAVILPTEQMKQRLQRRLPDQDATHWRVIAPFATDLALGHSNEAENLLIYWHLNNLTAARTEAVYVKLLAALARHTDYALKINVHNQAEAETMSQRALDVITQFYGIGGDSAEFVQIQQALTKKETPFMQNVDESVLDGSGKTKVDRLSQIKHFMARVTFRVNSDFATIRRDFNEARVLLDLGDEPNLFMQIRAISAGIPQVNRTATGYVQQDGNGTVVVSDAAAPVAVRTYLDQLTRWGQSLVIDAQLIDQHAQPQLLAQWEEEL
ncbi:accessory Sec system protein Asp1 [Lacticaseibacillus saniviri]|nr:accessory Sec system protein Asp1 [Lacticaseibacillus saniviri]MCG4282462.1 accessory Sec system protein Asp1 [Lacticaseibacillus saniviri]